jgi:UDP-glucose 4-epimerase
LNITVTGGSGFIGTPIVDLLRREGHDVTSFDLADGNDVTKDTLPYSNVVIHLAGVLGTAELFDTPQEAVRVNIGGSLNILEQCKKQQAAYIGITMPDVFPSVYTATKVASQRLATAYAHEGLTVGHVKAYNAFGKGQKHGPGHPQKIIPTFATKGWANEPIPIWGSGNQLVDLIHVDDLAIIFRRAVNWTQKRDDAKSNGLAYRNDAIFEGGCGQSMRVIQIAEMVRNITGSGKDFERLPMRAGEIETQLQCKPELKFGFSEARLREVVDSYKPDNA